MKNVFTLLALLFIATNSFSQNTETIQNWLDRVEKEFPEIDRTEATSTLRAGSVTYNRVRFNLLSDTYFIPAFGKSFDALSASKIKSIGKKIRGLTQKRKFGATTLKYPWVKRLDWYLWGVFSPGQHPYNTAVIEIVDLRRQRQEYTNTIEKLKLGELDFNYIALEKRQYALYYGKLIPKEIDFLKTLIDKQEKLAANKSLITEIENIKNFNNDFYSLQKINTLKSRNRIFYQSADFDTQSTYDKQIETKINQVLVHATAQEIKNISSMSISELNIFRVNFNKKYSSFLSKSVVRGANRRIKEVKTQKITNQFTKIESEINSSESLNDLSRLQDLYLTEVTTSSNPKIASLSKIFEAQRTKIKEDAKLKLEQQINEQETAVGEAMVFNSDGLYFAEFYDYIFRGHFENIEIKPQDMFLYSIFGQYIRAYGNQCASYLPENKVMIMDQECSKEWVTKDAYGSELSRSCIEWRSVPSGIYARPDLYSAKMEVENYQRKIALQNGIEFITNPNSMGNSVDLIHKSKGLKEDMLKIIMQNSCTSNSIKQFEENFKLYALNKPSIRLQGISKYTEMKNHGGPSSPQNFTKLIDDLVRNQAKTWGFNRYKQGSISNVINQYKDKQGRPMSLQANYNFTGFGGVSKGSVTVSFKNGLPECIYFSDFPNNCKNANASIVSSYAQGDYRK